MKPTIQEVRAAKQIAEAKINSIIAQFSHDFEIYDIDVCVDITKIKVESETKPIGIGVSTDIKVKL